MLRYSFASLLLLPLALLPGKAPEYHYQPCSLLNQLVQLRCCHYAACTINGVKDYCMCRW